MSDTSVVAIDRRLIRKRRFIILLLTLITSSSLLLQIDNSAKVSVLGQPYFPLQPVRFKVVRTVWGSTTAEIDAAAGDKNIPLIVTMRNMSNATVTGLEQTLLLQQPFSSRAGGQSVHSYFEGSISPGSTGNIQFTLDIDGNAAPGQYVLNMRVDCLTIVSGTGATLYIAQQTDVEVPVLISATRYVVVYDVLVDPEQNQPGGNITISGTVVNKATASSVYNTNISITSPVFPKGASVFIGQLDPNIPRPFSATLGIQRSLANGTYQGEIRVTYQDTAYVIHVSSGIAQFRVQQQTRTFPGRTTQQTQTGGPVQVIVDFLHRIFQFFFGSTTG